ncbi:cytochrome P450 [Granulicella arctica]|uniref:cytochrome P450 n=1 Tax=Granulicella arctica TaxID=940613 RepID=UPI0021E0922B|nr:cytochrome P450 [Granulicella arctica]
MAKEEALSNVAEEHRSSFPAGPSLFGRLRIGKLFAVDSPEGLQQNKDIYGDVLSFRTPYGYRQFQFNHPDDIQDLLIGDASRHSRGIVLRRARGILGDGLLTSEDPIHIRQRKLAQPAFHRSRIAGYGATIVRITEEMTARWEDGASIEAHEEMVALTLRITSRCLLGTDVRPDIQTFVDSMKTFNDYLPYALLPGATLLEKLPIGPMPGMKRALTALDALIYGIIGERRREEADGREPKDDLLAMLLGAKDDEGRMDDRQARDEALTILMAGHETTASALTFALWLIAKHPDVQERMREQVFDGIGDAAPRAGDYPKLGYVARVFAESMRMYPPAWISARTAMEDYTMRSGLFIPKGSALVTSPTVVQHDARFYPEPERFDPERFTDQAKAARPKFAYFPFGGGTRQCIGEGFAWMEAVLMLATVVQHWRLSLPEGSPEDLELLPRFTIRPKHAVPLRLERLSGRV